MTVDVAVVGAPFLDLTFEGLPHVPQPGEEILARAFDVTPGGTGLQAIVAARLGLSAALVAPVRTDVAGRLLRSFFEAEGVRVIDGGQPGPTPVTALLSTPDGVAMATVLGSGEPEAADVEAADARAVIASLGRLALVPKGRAAVYAVTGALEVTNADPSVPHRLAGVRAFVANAAEAAAFTGVHEAEWAARRLAEGGLAAVVTLGADGALAAEGEEVIRINAPDVPVVDPTGSGDAFAAAYVWADLRGMPLPDRLAWATLYASLSVRAPTGLAGAVRLEQLLDEGAARGLTPP